MVQVLHFLTLGGVFSEDIFLVGVILNIYLFKSIY